MWLLVGHVTSSWSCDPFYPTCQPCFSPLTSPQSWSITLLYKGRQGRNQSLFSHPLWQSPFVPHLHTLPGPSLPSIQMREYFWNATLSSCFVANTSMTSTFSCWWYLSLLIRACCLRLKINFKAKVNSLQVPRKICHVFHIFWIMAHFPLLRSSP